MNSCVEKVEAVPDTGAAANVMEWLKRLSLLAAGDPRRAARVFLAQAGYEHAEAMLRLAAWRDADVRSFEDWEPVAIKGKWGLFWLRPERWTAPLVPCAPEFTPGELKRLGQAVAAALVGDKL